MLIKELNASKNLKLFQKIYLFISPLLNRINSSSSNVIYDLTDIKITTTMKYDYYDNRPKDEFEGYIIKKDDAFNHVQVIDSSEVPVITVIDLIENYKKLFGNKDCLLILADRKEEEHSYIIAWVNSLYGDITVPEKITVKQSDIEWEKPAAIANKINMIISMYKAKNITAKTILIGSEQYDKFLEGITFDRLDDSLVKTLLELTEPIETRTQANQRRLFQTGYFIAPLIVTAIAGALIYLYTLNSIETNNKSSKKLMIEAQSTHDKKKEEYESALEALKNKKDVK